MSALRTGAIFAAAIGAASTQVGPAQAQAEGLRSAQAGSVDMFARDRALAVRDRPHPEYEARGVPAGAFSLFPKLQGDVEYTDNVYATTTGAVDDVVWRVKPEVALESGWSRHSLTAYARGTITRHQDFTTENTEEWSVGSSGVVDITREANLSGGLSYARQSEPRTASNTAVSAAEPIQYETTQANLAAVRAAGRLKLSARADYRDYDYKDGMTVGGATIDQSNRNRKVTSLSGRTDYAISPATAVFIQATANNRDYDIDNGVIPSRDSTGYEAVIGANFELGAISRGEIAAGYLTQQYDNSAYNDIDGFGARGLLEWFPTELTTVTFTGSRTIEDSGIIGSSGYLSSAVGIVVDHELLRNLILSGTLSYSSDEYNGVDRNDDRFGAALGGTYLVNRNLGVSLTASHLEQSSSGLNSGASFDINRLMLSLVSQF